MSLGSVRYPATAWVSFVWGTPIQYVDPSGHFAALAALALISPIGWVAIGVTAVAVVAYFAVPGVQEAVTNGMAQTAEAASNGLRVLFAKKSDVQYADYLAGKYGLDRAQRRVLHDWITRQGLSPEEIEEEAKALAELLQKNQDDEQEDDEEGQ